MKNRFMKTIGICLMVFMMATSGTVVYASKATKDKIEQKEQEIKQSEQELEQTQNDLKGLRGTHGELKNELQNLNENLTRVSTNLEELEQQITQKEADIVMTEADLEEAIRTEDEQYESMKNRIAFIYECGETLYMDLIFSATSFSDFLNKADYIEELSAYDRKMLENYTKQRVITEEKRSRLYQEKADLQALKEDVERQKKSVEEMVSKTSKNIAKYADDISDAERDVVEYEKTIEQQNQDLVELRKKYEEELAMSKLAAQSHRRDISEVVFDEGDRYLLANIIYCEAGGEPYEGQLAVGAVVINRVLSSIYPDTVVGVIYQRGQFEPVSTGRLALALASDKATARCYQAADEAMSGVSNVGNCVYFRTPIEGLNGIRIGGHIFY